MSAKRKRIDEIKLERGKKLLTWEWNRIKIKGAFAYYDEKAVRDFDEKKLFLWRRQLGFSVIIQYAIQTIKGSTKRITKDKCLEAMENMEMTIKDVHNYRIHYLLDGIPGYKWEINGVNYKLVEPSAEEAFEYLKTQLYQMLDSWTISKNETKKSVKKICKEQKTELVVDDGVKESYIGSIWSTRYIGICIYRLVGFTDKKVIVESVPTIEHEHDAYGNNSLKIDSKWLTENPVIKLTKSGRHTKLATPHWSDDGKNLKYIQFNKDMCAIQLQGDDLEKKFSWCDHD